MQAGYWVPECLTISTRTKPLLAKDPLDIYIRSNPGSTYLYSFSSFELPPSTLACSPGHELKDHVPTCKDISPSSLFLTKVTDKHIRWNPLDEPRIPTSSTTRAKTRQFWSRNSPMVRPPKAGPIMCNEEQSGIMFQMGDKFYFWFSVFDIIHEIFSEDLDKIVQVIAERGLAGLQKKVFG